MTPPLDAHADDVIAWLAGDGHLSAIDEDGRPLGEQASEAYRDHAREARRSFGDARDATGLPCNVAALEQVRQVWPAILGALAGLEMDRPPTMQRLLRRTWAATELAKLRALRAPDRALSREVSSLYKVTVGFRELMTALHLDGTVDADAPPCEEAQLFGWIEARRELIGARQVCAGSRAQIRQVWRALGTDGAPSALVEPWFAPALEAAIELDVLLASAAGVARALLLDGRTPRPGPQPVCARLFSADRVPRSCAALRAVPDGGALHPSLLFVAAEVPPRLRAFLEQALVEARSDDAFGAIDATLLAHASPIVRRLLDALGHTGAAPLTLEGLRRTCE